jgi:hypothetical protein
VDTRQTKGRTAWTVTCRAVPHPVAGPIRCNGEHDGKPFLIRQPPQGSLAQRKIAAGEQPLQLRAGEGLGAVDSLAATL